MVLHNGHTIVLCLYKEDNFKGIMGERTGLSMVTWAIVIVTVTVTVILDESAQVRSSDDLRKLVERVTEECSYIGLVMAHAADEFALINCDYFVPNPEIPRLEFAGRTFNIGKIKGVNVIYVVTGAKSVNAAISVQILVDKFQIRGIVHYGTAGSANYTLYLGDVGIPTHVAFTSSWSWKEIRSEKGENEELIFGDYDYPRKGDNLLGKVELTPQELISNSETNKEDHVFWLPIEPKWLTLATQLKNLKLQRCITLKDTYCLEESPKLVYDVRGSTADVLLHNKAYREFLSKHVNVSIVDQESAAVVAASLSNGVPCIVFRGVSDMAGGEEDPSLITSLLDLAATNALHVAVKFLVLLRDQTT